MIIFFFQAEDGIRDLVRSRGLGDVYKRQRNDRYLADMPLHASLRATASLAEALHDCDVMVMGCLLYTSDAADERSSVDLGGRRIIKNKKN